MRTLRYMAGRLVENIVLVLLLAGAMFIFFRLVPADPVATIVAPELSPEARAQQIEAWGLADGIGTQLIQYISGILQLDFGMSFLYRKPVMEILGDKLVNTLMIAVPSIVLSSVIGIWIGLRAGLRPGGLSDRLSVWAPPILRGIPSFWLGILLLMAFSHGLGLFPEGNMRTLGSPTDSYLDRFANLDFLWHLALPVLCLTLNCLPENIVLMRQSVRSTSREDFVAYLGMRGLPASNLSRHVFWNASLPVVTWVFYMFGWGISTTVVVEIVFAWPGLGREMANAVLSSDYPLAQGCFFLISAVVILLNLVLDFLYPLIDPRIARPEAA